MALFLFFKKDSSSPADNDVLGDIRFHGNDDGSTMTQYAQIKGTSLDVTNGTEDGQLVFNAILNGTNRERLKINATEAVFNEEGQDLDFRVESNGNANMLFVDAGNDRVGIGASTTNSVLHAATSGTGSIPTDHFIQTTDANTVFTAINTSDSATYSAIKLETRQTQASGFMIANEFQSAFNGDLVFRSRNAGTTSNENFRIKSSGNIIFTGKPATSPIFEMVNPDNEDTDTGRETSIRFSGHRSGGEDVVNAQIGGHHFW